MRVAWFRVTRQMAVSSSTTTVRPPFAPCPPPRALCDMWCCVDAGLHYWDGSAAATELVCASPQGHTFTSVACTTSSTACALVTSCHKDATHGALWHIRIATAGAARGDDAPPLLTRVELGSEHKLVLPADVACVKGGAYIADAASRALVFVPVDNDGHAGGAATVVATFPPERGVPLAVAPDADGNVWVGMCYTGQVREWRVAGRQLLCTL